MTAASPSEWAQMLSLAVALYSACSVPYFLLVDADAADFDPRPAVRRSVESGAFDPLLIAVTNARHTVRESFHAAVSGARLTAAHVAVALLLLVAPHTPETN